MSPWLGAEYGNPSSIHGFGQKAREAIENARGQVGQLLRAKPAEIVFTASGTEANNTVLRTIANRASGRGHLVVSAVEHPSVEAVAKALEKGGMEVSWVRPDLQGRIEPRLSFRMALDLARSDPEFRHLWIGYHPAETTHVRVGIVQEPFGLRVGTNAITFRVGL